MNDLKLITVAGLLSLAALFANAPAWANDEGFLDPLQGWHVLQPDFDPNHPLDVIAFEWDYFMIHDDNFAGIVGYVVANPRQRLDNIIQIVPNGANVAFVGERRMPEKTVRKCVWFFCWKETIAAHYQKPVADYHNLGTAGAQYSAEQRTFLGGDVNGMFGRMEPLAGGAPDGTDALRLTGRSDHWEWNLLVWQGMQDRNWQRLAPDAPFTVGSGTDFIPDIPGAQSWTVDALWPRTNVTGTVIDRRTGEQIAIDGKGYRENSWGRYLLSIDGWDFMVFSEEAETGVLMVMQTYHASDDLDFVDVSFHDNGQLVSERFSAADKTVGWWHPDWKWDPEPRSCVPESTRLHLRNDRYEITAEVEIGDRQRPMLSDATIGTTIFFIQEHFPTVSGEIRRVSDGSLVTTFSGQAGGEFAFHKDIALVHSDLWCTVWGQSKFYRQLGK